MHFSHCGSQQELAAKSGFGISYSNCDPDCASELPLIALYAQSYNRKAFFGKLIFVIRLCRALHH